MNKFRHQKYTYSKPFSTDRHEWSIVGPQGGVHFHVSVSERYGDSAGLEIHKSRGAGGTHDRAPDHTDCWLTGEPCWHEGTSHYASETLWPLIKLYLKDGDHQMVFGILEKEYEDHFPTHNTKENEDD